MQNNITLQIENNPQVMIENHDGDYYTVGSSHTDFNKIKQLAYQALTADKGVSKEAEGASREYPVYLEVPDSTVQMAPELGTRGRVRIGSISPENPHYGELAKLAEPFVTFPKEITPLPSINESLVSGEVRAHPDYIQAKSALLESMARDQDQIRLHPYSSEHERVVLAAIAEDPTQFIRLELERVRKERDPASRHFRRDPDTGISR